MADATEKLKYPRATTPKGRADYPWLNTPDTKFAATGVFKTKLVLPRAEAQPLMDALDVMAEEVYQAELAKRTPAAQKKKALVKEVPYSEICDEEGNETGEVAFSFKLNAKVVFKDKKTGEDKTMEFKPKFFDAAGTLLTKAPNVFGGSTIRINYEPTTYMVAGTSSCGISLRIYGIQIIKLVSNTGGNESATDMGFGKEDGYVADNFNNNANDNTPTGEDRGNAEDF